MAILHYCCFWNSVRKGSYASAIYATLYFGCSSVIMIKYLREEQEYLMGQSKKPKGESLLEYGDISSATVILNILVLACSSCLVPSSALVIFGLWKDKRHFLLPWIIFMFADIFIEFIHFIYLIYCRRLVFSPFVSVILTFSFFIMCLNTYCLLCVISQYQEFKNAQLNMRNNRTEQVS